MDVRSGARALAVAATLLGGMPSGRAMAQAVPVEVRQTAQGWVLLRDGAPYIVKGAGGDGPLDELAAIGANSWRTWDAEDLEERLDEAHALGLSVTVGLWLGHARHGFDYGDAEQVAAQKERIREAVLRYKDHPAVLIWGIGNEMEGFGAGDDPKVWAAVNDVAAMIHDLDPHHPTMTVTAEIGGERVPWISKMCPDIDIHGVNAYGGAPSLPHRYRAQGGTKPYLLTEFGPPGPWEVAHTAWGAPIEPTSGEKAISYAHAWDQAVAGAPGLALGAYAFLWGAKAEGTATWFGLLLPDGGRLDAVDALAERWGGTPQNHAPMIAPLVVHDSDVVRPGTLVSVRSSVIDIDADAIAVSWMLMHEVAGTVGGDAVQAPLQLADAVLDSNERGAHVRLPDAPGAYRLYLLARDERGGAATANVPLRVRPAQDFPVVVYQDSLDGPPWVPTGWMGDHQGLLLEGSQTAVVYEGTAAIALRYSGQARAGVAWQHPANNWGDERGGLDLTGARYLEFWARGEFGGEEIEVGVGLIGGEKPFPDSAISERLRKRLRTGWRRYRLPLRGMDLTHITTGLVLFLEGGPEPTRIYLDNIRFVE